MAGLQKQVAHFWRETVPNVSRVVAGVSGGPDSLALLHVLLSLLGNNGVVVAHLNHGLRTGAKADALFVEETAVSRHLSYQIETVDVAAHAAAHHLTLEEAGRQVRYRFLAKVARENGITAVVVGHHADDQAETVLMHLLRGTGLSGLRGMQMMRPLPEADDILLIRPLLQTSRQEIEAYCAQYDLHPVYDATNEDTHFFRNRIRHQLLPLLKVYNPRIKLRLQNLAQIVAADYDVLDDLLAETFSSVLIDHGDGWLHLDKHQWGQLPLSLKRGVLRLAVLRLRPLQRDIGFHTIEQTRILIEKGQVGSQAALPGELYLLNGYETITVADQLDLVPVDLPLLLDKQMHLPVPGEISLENGWVLKAELLRDVNFPKIEKNEDDWQAFVFTQSDHLIVRGRLPGERFQPLGMNGHSAKIKDVMINRKLPANLRHKWPLVALPEQVVWFVGHQIDERVRVTQDLPYVVKLTCRKKRLE